MPSKSIGAVAAIALAPGGRTYLIAASRLGGPAKARQIAPNRRKQRKRRGGARGPLVHGRRPYPSRPCSIRIAISAQNSNRFRDRAMRAFRFSRSAFLRAASSPCRSRNNSTAAGTLMLSEIELSFAIFFLPSPAREADIASLAGRAMAERCGF